MNRFQRIAGPLALATLSLYSCGKSEPITFYVGAKYFDLDGTIIKKDDFVKVHGVLEPGIVVETSRGTYSIGLAQSFCDLSYHETMNRINEGDVVRFRVTEQNGKLQGVDAAYYAWEKFDDQNTASIAHCNLKIVQKTEKK